MKCYTISHLRPFIKLCHSLQKDDLVVLDIDHTLLQPCDTILQKDKKQFYQKKLRQACKDHHKEEIDVLSDILRKRKMRVVDPQVYRLFDQLRQKEVRVICLTATRRGSYGCIESLEDWRLKEMNSLGFDFSGTLPIETLEIPLSNREGISPLYNKGILFSMDLPKGQVLQAFLKAIDFQPNRIVFIDDEFQHHQSFQEVFQEIDLYCFYYIAPLSKYIDFSLMLFQMNYYFQTAQWIDEQKAFWLFAMCQHNRVLSEKILQTPHSSIASEKTEAIVP